MFRAHTAATLFTALLCASVVVTAAAAPLPAVTSRSATPTYACVSPGAASGDAVHVTQGACPPGTVRAATAALSNHTASTGWYMLRVGTQAEAEAGVADDAAVYAAGFLEAAVTAKLMEQAFVNFRQPSAEGGDGDGTVVVGGRRVGASVLEKVGQWMEANQRWVLQQAANNSGDVYWRHVGLAAKQQQGMFDGYNVRRAPGCEGWGGGCFVAVCTG